MSTVLMKHQAYDLDKLAMKTYGITGQKLMGEAGKKIAHFIKRNFNNINSISIVIGKGNNGGDGLATALQLKKYNFNITVFSIFDTHNLSEDSLYYYEECFKKDIPIIFNSDPPQTHDFKDLVVDSILGIGFKGELNESLKKWTSWVNRFSTIISCDIATGICSNSGIVSQEAVKANYTVAMGYPKIGSSIEPGKSHSGVITSADIGFPKKIDTLSGQRWNVITDDLIKDILKPLKKDTHKYKQGKVLVLAGSEGMTGAAYLATMGALRSGCGLTKTFAPKSLNNIFERKITEGMTISCEDSGSGFFTNKNYSQIMDHADWADVILIGPGLGRNVETVKLLRNLYTAIEKPMVIDADGFSPFYQDISLIKHLKNEYVFTPHLGELGSLFNVNTEELKANIIDYIEKITTDIPGVLVAKGASTLISDGYNGYINSTGNSGLATAGTGDVLSGVIASFISQGYNLLDSSLISTYIHGYAAEKKSKKISQRGLIASDLLIEIGKKLSDYEL
tara:strand:+ start:612 stop:2135 length:1524 start_codon:yes stop_codon:yes gene_type:complete